MSYLRSHLIRAKAKAEQSLENKAWQSLQSDCKHIYLNSGYAASGKVCLLCGEEMK